MNKYYLNLVEKSLSIAKEVPNLTILGSDILRRKCVFDNYQTPLLVCGNLKIALAKIRDLTGVGRGLAANQIGSPDRCFVTFVDGEFQYFINPKILSTSVNTNWYKENCLSCGPVACDVERASEVTISFIDKKGLENEKEFDGFWARLLQHEIDHLNGVVNIDHVGKEDVFLINFDPLKEQLRDSR